MPLSRSSDTSLLVPAFKERLDRALIALVGQGYHPVVWETLRSKERAQDLVRRGKSKAKGGLSMHCYGVAADVVCRDHKWDCHKAHCGFFEALGVNAEDEGLTWGGRWPKLVDLPHVQLPPMHLQDMVRACKPDELEALCRRILNKEV